jgi:hypothetical protein
LSPAAHLSARIQKLTSTHNPCFSLFITQVAEDPKFYDWIFAKTQWTT